MLRELGLGMLFLLAGYEIELKELTGRGGRRALVTWLICLALAFAVVGLIGLTDVDDGRGRSGHRPHLDRAGHACCRS